LSEDKKEKLLLDYQEYQSSYMYNVFEVPSGLPLEKYCAVKERCYNSGFILHFARAVFEALA